MRLKLVDFLLETADDIAEWGFERAHVRLFAREGVVNMMFEGMRSVQMVFRVLSSRTESRSLNGVWWVSKVDQGPSVPLG